MGFPGVAAQFALFWQVTQTPGARQVPFVPHCALVMQATQISGPEPMLPVTQVGVAGGQTGVPLSSLHPLRQWWFVEHWGPCSAEVVEQSFAALTHSTQRLVVESHTRAVVPRKEQSGVLTLHSTQRPGCPAWMKQTSPACLLLQSVLVMQTTGPFVSGPVSRMSG